jgi:proteasome lid subunit RPN8/RPN11
VVTRLESPAAVASPGAADTAVLRNLDAYYPGPAGHPHPGPPSVAIPAAILGAIVEHARRDLPNEACGLIVGDRPAADGGVAVRWEPARNRLASPYRYEVHPEDLLRVTIETDRADEVIWAIVHSHVASPARPSPTDLRQALYPEALYILVSFDPNAVDQITGAESLRAWRIVDGGVHEVRLRARPEAARRVTARPVARRP